MTDSIREQDQHLLWAVQSQETEIVTQLMVRAHANPDAAIDSFGNSITHIAVGTGNVELVDVLFFYGANSGVKNNIGQSLWFPAVVPDTPDILGYMKGKAQTTFHEPDHIGMTPLDWASIKGNQTAELILRNWGADRLHEQDNMTVHNGLILPKKTIEKITASDLLKDPQKPEQSDLTVQELMRRWRAGGQNPGQDYQPPRP